MRRRDVLVGTALLVAAAPGFAQSGAQVVLFVTPFRILPSATFDILRQRLAVLGHSEGQNFTVVSLFGNLAELPGLLAKQKINVIFATGPESMAAATEATRTIPIVGFDLETDPVEGPDTYAA